jgi:glycosyltransferase involved in cell wall biosynthesis
MRILFLDQSGNLGGAELCLLDLAKQYRASSLVGLFIDGPFRHRLEQHQIPVQVLSPQALQIRKESGVVQSLSNLPQLISLITSVASLSRQYDLIYTNTQKAFVIGALASLISRRPLVCHLHDILSAEHFSWVNRQIAVTLANICATLVIANSQATQQAFIAAGGRAPTQVVYNGFEPTNYQVSLDIRNQLRQQMNWSDRFIVGQFSRLAPWKGQHVLLSALAQCSKPVSVILVGDALFGEQDYVQQLHQQVTDLGLTQRVQFLGFRSDIPQLMAACDVVAHTSTAAEPFGRVIVEAMLCGRPAIASAAGGAIELIEPGKSGWVTPPGDERKLAAAIQNCLEQPEQTFAIAQHAQVQARQRFELKQINQQIHHLLTQL